MRGLPRVSCFCATHKLSTQIGGEPVYSPPHSNPLPHIKVDGEGKLYGGGEGEPVSCSSLIANAVGAQSRA